MAVMTDDKDNNNNARIKIHNIENNTDTYDNSKNNVTNIYNNTFNDGAHLNNNNNNNQNEGNINNSESGYYTSYSIIIIIIPHHNKNKFQSADNKSTDTKPQICKMIIIIIILSIGLYLVEFCNRL